MSGKLAKSTVLYMSPRELRANGAKCGTCTLMRIGSSDCAILKEPKVSKEHGVCGLYIGGAATQVVQIAKLDRQTVGYMEGADVPTHCGGCEYYGGGEKLHGPCRVVEGLIDYWGCCNSYDRGMPRRT